MQPPPDVRAGALASPPPRDFSAFPQSLLPVPTACRMATPNTAAGYSSSQRPFVEWPEDPCRTSMEPLGPRLTCLNSPELHLGNVRKGQLCERTPSIGRRVGDGDHRKFAMCLAAVPTGRSRSGTKARSRTRSWTGRRDSQSQQSAMKGATESLKEYRGRASPQCPQGRSPTAAARVPKRWRRRPTPY